MDKSGLPDGFKAWIYQHALNPEACAGLCSRGLKEVQRLPHGLTSAALYKRSNTLQLPFSGLTEECRIARTREDLQYKHSRDRKVSSACIEGRTEKVDGSGGGRITGGGLGRRKDRIGLCTKDPVRGAVGLQQQGACTR